MAGSSVRLVNRLPAVAAFLPDGIQGWVNTQAEGLAERLREGVDPAAPAARTIQAGIYVRTPHESGYAPAVQRVESLFASDLADLFAPTLSDLFAPSLSALFAPSLRTLLDPRILPEVDAPPPGRAAIACATAWGASAEHGANATPWWWKTAREWEPDDKSFLRKLDEVING